MHAPRASRRTPAADELLSRVRLRTGRDLLVVNISDRGVLVEGARLLPGTHVDLHVITRDGRVLVRSRVLRAQVQTLKVDAIGYRSALVFDRAIDTAPVGYRIPGGEMSRLVMAGSPYPVASDIEAGVLQERPFP